MARQAKGQSVISGLAVVVFVVLMGALSYTYLINYNAEVATKKDSSDQIAAQTVEVPEAKTVNDLSQYETLLEDVSVDHLSDDSLQVLDEEFAEF